MTIRRALLSVSDKTGLESFARCLEAAGVEILSTGGTARLLREADIIVTDVASITGFPEIMDGRVKTLHPKIHAGLLARHDNEDHLNAMQAQDIESIDLLVANLYPFEATIAVTQDHSKLIENIDIGGPAMLRAAAKNHDFVTVVCDPADYPKIADEISKTGKTSVSTRQELAAKTFAQTAAYDVAIANWMSVDNLPEKVSISGTRSLALRYGENPHQEAALYKVANVRAGVSNATQIQGKPLSYNNINDTDAAFELVAEFDAPTIAIVKHANPCGVASATSLVKAWHDALATDPISAFGGIVAMNRSLDEQTAKAVIDIFIEVVIAPDASDAAKSIIAEKPNLRLLLTGSLPDPRERFTKIKSVAGGFLMQSRDNGIIGLNDLEVVTKRTPTTTEMNDLMFAWKVAKHVKSNAIVFVKDGCTAGVGAGQMSRLDSARIAVQKAQNMAAHYDWPVSRTIGSVVASDAFFPFADGLEVLVEAGATAVVQPGGSKSDNEIIAAADEAGVAMAFTGMRHFNH